MHVQLRSRVADIEKRSGLAVTEDDVALLLHGDCDVYKPNGEPLLVLRRKAIPGSLISDTRAILSAAAHRYGSDNRSKYAGLALAVKVDEDGKRRSNRTVAIGEDGVMRRVVVESAIIGYFDRQKSRFPYCRATKFTATHVNEWSAILPLVHRVNDEFRAVLPHRHAVQLSAVAQCLPQFIIEGTPFSTLTVNRNIAARIHKDAGDFKEGFGCLSVARAGIYAGGWLVFPEYRVAVDLGDGDTIFFNSHDWHGVTDFKDTEPGFERISVVYYLRKKMNECLAPKDEVARLRAKQGV